MNVSSDDYEATVRVLTRHLVQLEANALKDDAAHFKAVLEWVKVEHVLRQVFKP